MENKIVLEKLLKIQNTLKCNKGQYNSFGKYKYRSCEDILEAVKPLCALNSVVLNLSDQLIQIGDRYYVKAIATLISIEDGSNISNSAYAREDFEKKGMDGSQITGTASSYARKYALNGLFCIDDTKDADTDEYKIQTEPTKKATASQIKVVQELIKSMNNAKEVYDEILKMYDIKDFSNLTSEQYGNILLTVKKMKGE